MAKQASESQVHITTGKRIPKVKKLTRLEDLQQGLPKGYLVCTYSPGDGLTRYRFFRDVAEGDKQTYFGPKSGIFTALGFKEAYAFARGLEG